MTRNFSKTMFSSTILTAVAALGLSAFGPITNNLQAENSGIKISVNFAFIAGEKAFPAVVGVIVLNQLPSTFVTSGPARRRSCRKLLRVLQEREFERVGGTRPIQVDVRIIAATNRDLQAAVKEQGFRQDLFFRLNVLSVVLPALRERREDIALLAGHFVRKLGQKTKRRVDGLSPAAVAALRKYDWPGNVRELENAVERAVVLGSSDVLLPEDLPESVLEASDAAWDLSADQPAELKLGDFQQNVNEAKRRAVREALERAGGVYTEAAKLLGVHPNYLHRLVKNLGLR